MIPCLSVFLASLVEIFGIVALVTDRQSQRPKGFAIAGTALGAAVIVIFASLMVFAHLSSQPKPFVVKAPEYKTMVGEGLTGSGFHFRSGNKNFIACSLHQLDVEAPKTMLAPDLETKIPITGQVRVGTDIQVLSYGQEPDVSVGDPVYLLIDGEAVKAHFTRYSLLEGHGFKSKTSFVGQGGSGSPVISGQTGHVIGVFLGGEDGDAMTEGYFEDLQMP